MSNITTINSTDVVADSRADINTNFSNLNTDKLESSAIIRVYKASDETVNNSTTLQNDDDLTFSIGANEVWAINGALILLTDTNADFKFTFDCPSGCDGYFGNDDYPSDVDTSGNISPQRIGYNGFIAGTIFPAEVHFGGIYGVLINGANAGTVTLQWAQNTARQIDTTLKAGSYLIATKLN